MKSFIGNENYINFVTNKLLRQQTLPPPNKIFGGKTVLPLFSSAATVDTLHVSTAISIKVVPKQNEKVEYERENLLGMAIKNTQIERNLISRDS